MAVLIPQVVTEDRASGAQIIENSLRFDKTKSQYLTRTPGSAGNRKKSTISYWIKRTIPVSKFNPTTASVFGVEGGSSWFDLSYYTVDEIQFVLDAGVGDQGMKTQASYRDFSNWYHICAVLDTDRTNDDGANSRMRVWVNGKETVQKATSSGQPSAGQFTFLNDSGRAHHIGRDGRTSSIRYGDNYLAQFYIVDGLVLGPDHFGYYDPLSNVWRPKKFTADGTTINDGRSWSGTSSVTNNNGNGNGAGSLAAVFNGTMTANSSNAYGFTTGAMDFTWTPNTPIPFGSQVRVWTGFSGGTIYLNGDQEVVTTNNNAWTTIVNGKSGSIESIRFVGGSGGGWWAGVEVDGVVLVDSTAQNLDFGTNGCYLPLDGNTPIGEDQSGKGNNWRPVNFGGSTSIEKATGARPILNTTQGGTVGRPGVFGSDVSAVYETTSASNSGGQYYFSHDSSAKPTFSFIRGATYTFDWSASTNHPLRFSTTTQEGGGTATLYSNGVEVAGNVTKITVPHDAPDTLYYYCNVHSGMGNSISVTTDETKADKYASSLVLACPYAYDKEDVSGLINCTVSNKGSDNYGSIQHYEEETDNFFYRGARKFDGSNDNINYSSSSSLSFPGTFTLEMYATPTTITDGAPISSKGYYHSNGNWYLKFTTQSGGRLQFYSYSPGTSNGQTNDVTNTGTTNENTVHHIVCQRDSSNLMSFMIDGVLVHQESNVTHNLDDGGTNGISVGRMAQNNSSNSAHVWYGGYIGDLRMYKGIEKYDVSGKGVGDQIFIPASTNPDVIPDSPSGVPTKSKLSEITDGSVNFDGNVDYLATYTSSSDLTLGTGDFTVEMFLYNRETGGNGFIQISDSVGGLKNTSTGVITIHKGSGENGIFRAYVKNGSTGFTQTVPYKKWCHVALVRESGTVKLFVDGKQDATTVSNDTTDYSTGYIAIGGYYDTNYLSDCTISNVRVNKGTALYTKDFIPPSRKLTNVTNTKILCCQSNTQPGGAAVSPNMGGINDGTQWSKYVTGAIDTSFPAWRAFRNDTASVGVRTKTATDATIVWQPPSPISFSSSFRIWAARDGSHAGTRFTVTHAGGTTDFTSSVVTSTTQTAVDLAQIGGVTSPISRIVVVSGGPNPRFSGIEVDGTMLVDPLSPVANLAATTFNPFNTTDIDTSRGHESGYCTLNPADGFVSLKEGNLETINSTGWQGIKGSLGMSTGKFYWETQNNQSADAILGMTDTEAGPFKDGAIFGSTGHGQGDINPAWCWAGANYYFNATSASSGGMSNHVATDIVQYAFDADAGKLWFGRNGTWFSSSWEGTGDPSSGTNATVTGIDNTKTYVPCATLHNGSARFNFGQKPFKFSPPDGFQPITTSTARPITVIARPDQYVKAVQYTGTGADLTLDVGFKPDFSYFANKTGNGYIKYLFDSVRGATKALATSGAQGSNAEDTQTEGLKSFNSNGVTIGNNGQMNENANNTWISWHWKAGGGKPSGGGFFKDDVEYADAAALNMSVGSLNSAVYDDSQVWSNYLTRSGGSGFTNQGSGAFAGYDDANNYTYVTGSTSGTNYTMTFTPPSPISYSESVAVRVEANNSQVSIDGGNTYVQDTGGLVVFRGSGTFTSIICRDSRGQFSGEFNSIRVDGVLLVDNGTTPPNAPSVATTAVSVGTKQGFSVLRWTGGGADTTLAHGLTKAPTFMLVKHLDSSSTNWIVYHHRLADATKYLRLNSTATQQTQAAAWNSKHPTSSVIHLGAEVEANHVGQRMVAYVWHDVPGLQKFGKWTNNNSIYGAYINLGFRPAIILLKDIDGGEDWYIIDSIRHPYNQPAPSSNASGAVNTLNPNTNHHEANSRNGHTNTTVDILSNGFKIRSTNTGAGEISYGTRNYVYAAWADAPTFNLYGAQSNAR